MMEVDIYSFGMETSFSLFGDLPVTKEMRDAFTEYKHKHEQRNAVQAMLARQFIVEYINRHTHCHMPPNFVVIDCRGFWENRHTLNNSNSQGHTGLHPENLTRIMQHNHFKRTFLPDFYEQFGDAMKISKKMQRGRIGIAVYCNKGRDRSVGCAELLRQILRTQKHDRPQFQVRVKHICKDEWRQTNQRICPYMKCKICYGNCFEDMGFAREYGRHSWEPLRF